MRRGTTEDLEWIVYNYDKLHNDHNTFDITFLYDLISRACPSIRKYSPKLCGPSSLEASLQRGKELRNTIVHDPKSTAILPETFIKIKEIAIEILIRTCRIFKLSPEEEQRKLLWLRELIQAVEEAVETNEEKKIMFIDYLLKTKGAYEQNHKLSLTLSREFIPFSNVSVSLSTVYYYTGFYDMDNIKEVTFEDILARFDVNFCFICGPVGAGKSCLVKQLSLDFVDKISVAKFPSVRDYENVFYVSCRETNCASLCEYLSEIYRDTTDQLDYEDVLEALKRMKLLILIDGLDELNLRSKCLIDDIIEHFKKREATKFVLTCRSVVDLELRTKLEKENIKYDVYNISPLKSLDDQSRFLQKYADAMPIRNCSSNLIEMFQKQPRSASCHYMYPLGLMMFCHLFQDMPESISDMHHEGKLMDQIMKLSKLKICKVIEANIFDNTSIIALKVFNIICQISLYCLHHNILKIDAKIYMMLEANCMKINNKVSVNNCITCILHEQRVYPSGDVLYLYPHRSHQEYLAAIFLVGKLKNSSNGSTFLDLLTEALEEDAPDVTHMTK